MDTAEAEEIQAKIEELSVRVQQSYTKCRNASANADPELLSIELVELASLNSALGHNAAKALYISRLAERAYYNYRERKKIETIDIDKKSATYADAKKYVEAAPYATVWNEAQLVAEQASDLSYRTDTFLKMAQSRLSVIKNDIARA